MNFRKLLTYLAVGTAAVIPFAGAQNPTILQGNYVSNVFGQSNFILNPNAQTNTANVTVSNATVTRSTTTPLVATTEFTITTSTATGYADWATRTFDAGMKNQNCEARFTYRGFSVGSTTVQIRQGSNTVAQLTLTASTDPRIASINFPCGDLSSATTLRVQQATASLTGTNELSGLYLGLATNQANVAQAEFVGSLVWPNSSAVTNITATSFTAFSNIGTTPTVLGNVAASGTAPKVTISNLKPGNYRIIISGMNFCFNGIVDSTCVYRLTDGTTAFGSEIGVRTISALSAAGGIQGQTQNTFTFDFQYTGAVTSKTFQLEAKVVSGGEARIETGSTYGGYQISVYRFPTSSELVVTPERQNTFGEISGTGVDPTTTSSTYVTPAGFTLYTNGKCLADGTNLACKISTLPPGSYKVDVSVPYFAVAGTAQQNCQVQIKDNKGSVDAPTAQATTQGGSQVDGISSVSRTFHYTSIQTDVIFSFQHKQVSGTGGSCGVYTSGSRYFVMNVTPLNQPSNSALYVQGPVLGAQTGAAIPAGYVGEVLKAEDTGWNNATSASYRLLSLTLTPGVWDVQSTCNVLRNGATWTDANLINSATNQNSNPTESYIAHLNQLTPNNWGVPSQIYRVSWNGTTNIMEGSTNTSSPLIYSRCYPGAFTGGPVQLWQKITARRVN
jgi:hypothetical protein